MRTAVLSSVALAVACTSSPSFDGKLDARFVDHGGQALVVERASALSALQGLYFGELEIVAYDHRPGEALQASGGFGRGTPGDWSYWIALQSGHDAGRDNVLQLGQQIDFTAMNGDYARPIEQEFIDQVGRFELDFVEVYMMRTGVIHDGKYYGMNADLNGLDRHPLHKYPQWSSIDDTFCLPEYPGVPAGGQDLNVFFARRDWFPAPVVVRMAAGAAGPVVESSTPALTADQRQKIESLVSQGTQRRFYQDLLFVPYDGPVALDLANGQTPPPLPDGGTVAAGPALTSAGSVVNAKNVALSVNFDLADILAASTDFQTPRVVYKGDANNVPFGLQLTLEPVADQGP